MVVSVSTLCRNRYAGVRRETLLHGVSRDFASCSHLGRAMVHQGTKGEDRLT